MQFHYQLLINPAAGGGNGQVIGDKIISLLQKNQLAFTSYWSEYPQHEASIVAELLPTLLTWSDDASVDVYPLLLVIGGDGTLHQVVNHIQSAQANIPIAYIPAGSGNDFARAVGLPKEIKKIFWKIVKQKEPRALNILTYEEKIKEQQGIALNNIGIGLDAAIVQTTNQSTTKQRFNKWRLNSLSYLVAIFSTLFTQKGFPILVESNGQTLNYPKAFLCTTTNHPYFGGGINIAPMADITKPTFDFVLVERIAFYKIIWLILLLFQKKHPRSKYFHHISTTNLRIVSTTPQPMHVDGESLDKEAYDLFISMHTQLFWL